jgi:hypothetical protein
MAARGGRNHVPKPAKGLSRNAKSFGYLLKNIDSGLSTNQSASILLILIRRAAAQSPN